MPEKFPVFKCALLGLVLALAAGNPALAGEDLTDNETCMECHAEKGTADLMTADVPEVHTENRGFHVEAHEMWNCVDCHTGIKEIPHPEDVDGSVDCLECHEEMPSK